MSKYNPLWNHIQQCSAPTYKMSFHEIKDVLGFEIDHSFLNFKKELIQYGYQVQKVSLKEKWVNFSKVE